MTNLFSNLNTTDLEEQKESVGGFSVLESDVYEALIKAAYVTYSKSGAAAVNVIADIDGREYRETIYVTNKEGKNYYTKDGKKIALPGFTTINELCLCCTGKELSAMESEERVFKLYDFDQKKEVPQPVPTLIELINTKCWLAIQKETVDKNVKDAMGDYVPSGETRDQNVISKVFEHESKMTVTEAKTGSEKAQFMDKWIDRNKGKTRDRTAKGAKTAKPAAAAPTQAPKKSLFSK